MAKKIFIITLCIITLIMTGCSFNKKINQNDNVERFYLNDEYYNKGNFISIDSDKLNKMTNESYVLFTYNNYCSMSVPCEEIFEEFMKKYKIDFLSIPFEEFKNTNIYKTVKYAPSVILVEKGNVVAYLDAESDDDLNKYQDINEFEEWMNNYVYFSR